MIDKIISTTIDRIDRVPPPPINRAVSPTNEIVAAIFSSVATDKAFNKFTSDPRLAILEMTGADVESAVSITVEQNQGDAIHLVLPYYSAVEEIQEKMLDGISDSELGDISGGEIFISLCIFGGMFIGGVVGGTGALVAGAAIGAVVAGGIAGAAVIGGTTAGIVEREKQDK